MAASVNLNLPLISRFKDSAVAAALGIVLALPPGAAQALDFELFETPIKVDTLVTIGASFRMQEIDSSLIGKSTLHRLNNPITDPTAPVGSAANPRGLCYTRRGDNGVNAPLRDTATAGADGNIQLLPGVINDGCSTNDTNSIRQFVAAPGSYNPSGDNGDLNFEKGDIVHAVAKITSDISFTLYDFNFFVRPIYFFDANYTGYIGDEVAGLKGFLETHPDTTMQAARTEFPDAGERAVGRDFDVLDYNISKAFNVLDRDVSIKVGNQVLNWGESALLIFNSLNSVNPLDATRLRMPGLDLKELFQPQGMVVLSTDIIENVSLETFYQYEWKPLIVDPPGSFFSVSDTLGAGGFYAQNGQGREPEDPYGFFRGIDTCNPTTPAEPGQTGPCFSGTGTLGSTSSRIVPRNFAEEAKRKPDDGGQYGAALKLFLEDFNNGTELSFYFANYHSRLPIVSTIAATVRSCIVTAADLGPGGACGYLGPGQDANNPATPANEETLPVDTISLFLEYPEDIQMYGVSFNTTVGDWAWSGEIAYRPKLPTQIHTLDLSLAALGPAFPQNDVVIGPIILGQRAGFPDFVSLYRGLSGGYDNGDYIRGYEELQTAQYGTTFLKLIGGDNPIGASQMTFLMELGMNQVFNMPGLDELQFQGGGVDTPISSGADGVKGINPRDVRCPVAEPNCANANDPSASRYDATPQARQNATPHKDLKGFGTSESYGYRILNLNRWDSALFGANIELLNIIQHDVKGTTPGIGTNFVHGRKQFASGLRFDYLSTWIGEVRYQWFTGGKNRDGQRDRDNVFVTLGYQF